MSWKWNGCAKKWFRLYFDIYYKIRVICILHIIREFIGLLCVLVFTWNWLIFQVMTCYDICIGWFSWIKDGIVFFFLSNLLESDGIPLIPNLNPENEREPEMREAFPRQSAAFKIQRTMCHNDMVSSVEGMLLYVYFWFENYVIRVSFLEGGEVQVNFPVKLTCRVI